MLDQTIVEQLTDTISVLVMDDSPILRKAVNELLMPLPIDHIFEADSTAEAVRCIQSHRINLAILDIQVPGHDDMRSGIDVLKWVRRHLPELPVIMITNYDLPTYRNVCIKLGAAYFFDKSYELQKLPQAVAELLSRSASPSSLYPF